VDPVMRRVVGGRATSREAASTSEMGRFETGMLAQRGNLNALMELSGRWIDRANGRTEQKKVILDLDSSESPVYGEQGVRPAMATSDAMVIIRLSASTFRWRRSPYRAAFSQRSFVGSVGYAQCRSDGTGSGQRHRKTRLRRGKLSAAVGKQRYPAPFGSV
jgi:hypothetical protein